jgi:hypothetical protein
MIPDQHAVEEFVATGRDPPLHDRIHAGHLDAGQDRGDAGVGHDGVEQGRVLAVAVTDDVLEAASGVVTPSTAPRPCHLTWVTFSLEWLREALNWSLPLVTGFAH